MNEEGGKPDFGQTVFTVPDLKPGQKLSDERFELIEKVGQGGMGVVWKASDQGMNGQTVALKFLPDLLRLDPEAIKRLKEEAQAGRGIHHSNIVAIYDLCETPQHTFIAMEYVDGTTLSEHKLKEPSECFDVDRIQLWVHQMCDALAFAHEKHDVVHRDVKPNNILISRKGHLRILDFGLSRLLTDSVTRLSRGKSSGASLGYSSPQQVRGKKPTVSDDIYSLGATIFELLTGEPPFCTGDVYNQTLSEPVSTMADRRRELGIGNKKEIPEVWEKTVAACLAKEPEARPQSIADVWKRLSGTEPVRPGAKSRSKALIATMSVSAALLLGLLAQQIVDFGSETKPGIGQSTGKGSGSGASGSGSGSQGDGKSGSGTKGSVVHLAKGSVRIVSVPSGARVFDVHQSQSIGTTPLEIADLDPGKPVRYRLDLPNYEDAEVEGNIKGGEELTLEAKLLLANGSVHITSIPSEAIVEGDDGTEIGRTPLKLDARPGSASYKLTLNGYRPIEVGGTVNRGEVLELNGKFSLDSGTVTISSTPSGASVADSGGAHLGNTPLTLRDISTGYRSFKLSLPGYQSASLSGTVFAGKTLPLSQRLAEEPGRIKITSSPSGASVYSGGRRVGMTPFEDTDYSTGHASFTLKRDGYEEKIISGQVSAGRLLELHGTLEKVPTRTFRVVYDGKEGVYIREAANEKAALFAACYPQTQIPIRQIGDFSYQGDGSVWAQLVFEGWMVAKTSTTTYMQPVGGNQWRVTWYGGPRDNFVNMRIGKSTDASRVAEANTGVTVIALEQQQVGTKLWIHAAFSGWTCIRTKTGRALLEETRGH